MTKGELPKLPVAKSEYGHFVGISEKYKNGQEDINNNTMENANLNNDLAFRNKKLQSLHDDVFGETCNIQQYLSALQNPKLKQRLTRILSVDEQCEIDIESIEHFLYVAKKANSHNTLECCKNWIMSNLTVANYDFLTMLNEKYDLNLDLATVFKEQVQGSKSFPTQEVTPYANLQGQTANNNIPYYVFLSCDTCTSQRSITAFVYDCNMRLRCTKLLKRGKKISKVFQSCCVQADETVEPYLFWSFGSSVYRYDPLKNKCKKRANLRCKRSKFNLVAYGDRCYAIGGIYQIRKVLEIEEYVCSKKGGSWKKVVQLPGDSLPISPSSVVCNGLIYIFCSILDIEGKLKPNTTAVYAFNPSTKTVKQLTEIPYSFKFMKTCAVESNIYIFSEKGEIVVFSTSNCSVHQLPSQTNERANFGLLPINNSLVICGGRNKDGKCMNTIRQFWIETNQWEILIQTLPDCMEIHAACEIKIPSDSKGIVPFFDTNCYGQT